MASQCPWTSPLWIVLKNIFLFPIVLYLQYVFSLQAMLLPFLTGEVFQRCHHHFLLVSEQFCHSSQRNWF